MIGASLSSNELLEVANCIFGTTFHSYYIQISLWMSWGTEQQ